MKANNTNKSRLEGLFYNNRFLAIFCAFVSVILWATVKINYSADTVRVLNDLKVNLGSTAEELDFTAFVSPENLLVDVEVTGKAYNINAHALSKDDIVVEATSGFIDSAGYRVVSLSARIADAAAANDFEVTNISPSTITVYYDRKVTDTFNVIARVSNDLENAVKEGFILGKPVPSLNTVEVTGPATILSKMSNVYFDAVINEKDLPLVSSVELGAEISYPVGRSADSIFLVCETVNSQTNPATVTLPVYAKKTVPVTVKFINQPEGLELPEYSITPSKVEIIYNPKDAEKYSELNVGTVDFKKLDNTLNNFAIDIDQDKLAVKLTDKQIKSFDVSVDMSEYTKKTVSYSVANVIFLNKKDEMVYSLGTGGTLDSITVIGPKKSVQQLTSDDISIEINVSALNNSSSSSHLLDANISVSNSKINNCWVYGEYKAYVTEMTEDEAEDLATSVADSE